MPLFYRIFYYSNFHRIFIFSQMNMQLIRVYPGLPALPFNTTDLRHPTTTDYHPLFERFSSLFIPLIVLAAICAFVAIITVVCLLKKSQRNELENKEKILRPLVRKIDRNLYSTWHAQFQFKNFFSNERKNSNKPF
jgi:hypothetical protein